MNVVPNLYPTHGDGEGTVTKKRKIDGDLIEKAQGPLRSKKPFSGRPRESTNSQDIVAQTEGGLFAKVPAEVPRKKRKKRKSIGQNSTRKRAKLVPTRPRQEPIPVHIGVEASVKELEPLAQHEIVESPGKQLGRELDSRTEVTDLTGLGIQRPTEVGLVEGIIEQTQSIEEPMDIGADEENLVAPTAELPTKPKKRKKRRSIGQVQKPRKKSTELTPVQAKGSSGTQTPTSKTKTTTTPSQAKTKRKKTLSEPKTAEQRTIDEVRDTEPIDSPNVLIRRKALLKRPLPTANERSPPSPRPKTKKPSRPRTSNLRTSMKPKPTSKPPPKNSIPITVFRLSHPLPSSTLTLPTSSPKNPNPVDVLSQFCRELLAKPLSFTTATSSPSSQERKRKQRAVEMYAEELESRLFDLTQTLDMNTLLARRVRLATKEEKGLRKELASLTDDIESIHHRKQELKEQEENVRKEEELSSLLTGIGEAVRKGRERGWNEDEKMAGGFELGLRKIAGSVSGWEGGGVLQRVKGVSEMLEGLLAGRV